MARCAEIHIASRDTDSSAASHDMICPPARSAHVGGVLLVSTWNSMTRRRRLKFCVLIDGL